MNNVAKTNEAKRELRDPSITDPVILFWLESGDIPGVGFLFYVWFLQLVLWSFVLYGLWYTVHIIIKYKVQDEKFRAITVMLFFLVVFAVVVCGESAVSLTKAYIEVKKLIRKEKDLNIVATNVSSSLPLYNNQSNSTIVPNNKSAILPVTDHDDTLGVVVRRP